MSNADSSSFNFRFSSLNCSLSSARRASEDLPLGFPGVGALRDTRSKSRSRRLISDFASSKLWPQNRQNPVQ